MKTNVCVTLDSDLVVEARLQKIKFSQLFNNVLKTTLEMEEKDADVSLEERIVNAKARVMSLEADKKKQEEERAKRFVNRREL